MGDRVALTLEGRRYVRQNSVWVCEATNLKAASNVATQLDALARSTGIWEGRLAQDAADAPRGRRRHGISFREEEDGTWVRVAPVPAPPRQPTRRRRGDHPAEMSATFNKNGHGLVLSCDFERGWRETAKWLFCASDSVTLPGDNRRLRLTVTLLEDVRSPGAVRRWFDCGSQLFGTAVELAALSSRTPAFADSERQVGSIRYILKGASCNFVVPLLDEENKLNCELPWFNERGCKRFSLREYGIYEQPVGVHGHQMCVARPFQLELDGALLPAPRSEVPDEFEYDTPMPSAGLPGLSKRRRT